MTTEKTKLVSLHNKLVVYLIYTDRWVSKWLVAESTSFDMIMFSVLNQGYLNSLEKIILNWELFLFQNMIAIQAGSERLLVFTIFLQIVFIYIVGIIKPFCWPSFQSLFTPLKNIALVVCRLRSSGFGF